MGLHSVPSRRAFVLALCLIAAFALGYLAGRLGGPHRNRHGPTKKPPDWSGGSLEGMLINTGRCRSVRKSWTVTVPAMMSALALSTAAFISGVISGLVVVVESDSRRRLP